MSLILESRKPRIYQIDDSPKFHQPGFEARENRRHVFRHWIGLVIVGGLGVMFWILAVKGF